MTFSEACTVGKSSEDWIHILPGRCRVQVSSVHVSNPRISSNLDIYGKTMRNHCNASNFQGVILMNDSLIVSISFCGPRCGQGWYSTWSCGDCQPVLSVVHFDLNW